VRFIYWIPEGILALNKIHILPFLVLLLTTLTSMPMAPAFAVDDLDNDGVEDSMDACPNLQEDNEGAIDG